MDIPSASQETTQESNPIESNRLNEYFSFNYHYHYHFHSHPHFNPTPILVLSCLIGSYFVSFCFISSYLHLTPPPPPSLSLFPFIQTKKERKTARQQKNQSPNQQSSLRVNASDLISFFFQKKNMRGFYSSRVIFLFGSTQLNSIQFMCPPPVRFFTDPTPYLRFFHSGLCVK